MIKKSRIQRSHSLRPLRSPGPLLSTLTSAEACLTCVNTSSLSTLLNPPAPEVQLNVSRITRLSCGSTASWCEASSRSDTLQYWSGQIAQKGVDPGLALRMKNSLEPCEHV